MDFGIESVDGIFAPGRNGRVADVGAGSGAPVAFQMFSDDGGRTGGFVTGTLSRVWEESLSGRRGPSEIFMSRVNVDALHDAIRYRVHVETGGRHVIGRQSDAELALVMRSIVLQHGRNDTSSDAIEQVRVLNAAVLAWCVPRIVNELNQYVRYREDVATLPVPMPHGGLATNKGSRQIEMKRFL